VSGVPFELRPYQVDVLVEIERAIEAGKRRILLVAPTGSGKTIIGSELIRRYVARYQTALFLGHRREIVTQNSRKLSDNGVRHGVIMSGVDPRLMERVQVGSIDTLLTRSVRDDAMKMPPADLLIFDEAHHSRSRTREHLINSFPYAALVGMTATPTRADGRGLGDIFEVLIECPQIPELIEGGYLVKSRVYAPVDVSVTKGVRVQSGDWAVSQLSDRMNTVELIGDIVSDWLKHGERRKTVAFAVSVEHSRHICNEFVRAGVRAEHLEASTSINEREAILGRLGSGETELVVNCMILVEGFDCPDIGCIILARPTRQMGLFRQMIGRGLRAAPDKKDCVVLDHSGACYRHGLPEDRVEWVLDVDGFARNKKHEARKAGTEAKLKKCPSCQVVMASPPPCVSCGWMPKPRSRRVDFADGELGLVTGGIAKRPQYSPEERKRWHGMLASIAAERGYQRGWISHKFREKFGDWPPWGVVPEPVTPTPECRSWVKSRQIAWVRGGGAASASMGTKGK
jgi:DNA repair protein RadD